MNRQEVVFAISQASESVGQRVLDQFAAVTPDSPKEIAFGVALTIFLGHIIAYTGKEYSAIRKQIKKSEIERYEMSRVESGNQSPNPLG